MVLLVFAAAGCSGPTRTGLPVSSATAFAPGGAPATASIGSPVDQPTAAAVYPVGSVRAAGAMLARRAAHTATLHQNGRVLIAGGFGQGDDAYVDSAEVYDPAAGAFAFTGRMAVRRCCHTATRLPDGRVLIAGGFNGSYLADADLYDPTSGEFTPTGSLTTPRMDHVAVLLDDGKVLVAGGVGAGWTFLASAELYDPTTGAFTPTGDMTAARESHTATKLQDGRVLIAGGHRGRHAAIVIYESAEIYDPVAGSFSPTGYMTLRRHKHDGVLLADGRVLVTGGSDERDDQAAYPSAETYDPATGAFTRVGDMPTVRYKHVGTSLLLDNGRVLIAGGARNAVIFDGGPGTFRTVPGDLGTATLSRLFSTASLLPDGSALIAGGYGLNQDVSAQTWLYHP